MCLARAPQRRRASAERLGKRALIRHREVDDLKFNA
jgi:hypothetical protein